VVPGLQEIGDKHAATERTALGEETTVRESSNCGTRHDVADVAAKMALSLVRGAPRASFRTPHQRTTGRGAAPTRLFVRRAVSEFHLILTRQRHVNGTALPWGVAAMSIRPFLKPGMSFDSEALAAMDEAFEAACKALDDTGQPYIVREIIAERIIEAARRLGERDPARLVKAALPWLDREWD
jgi:hypothetical protein